MIMTAYFAWMCRLGTLVLFLNLFFVYCLSQSCIMTSPSGSEFDFSILTVSKGSFDIFSFFLTITDLIILLPIPNLVIYFM